MKRCGTTDDVQALEEIVNLSILIPDNLEEAQVALGEIFEIALARVKGDDLSDYAKKYGGPLVPGHEGLKNWTDLHGRQE